MQLLEESTKSSDSNVTASTTTTANMEGFYPPKPKISTFNDMFMCHLCGGYMINPTTIDVCMHTYCRSCIARHLAADSFCPQCKAQGGKALTISNLKSDDILRSIIYKLVPGLYQKERERIVQFVNNTKTESHQNGNSSSSSISTHSLEEYLDKDDHIFSANDPISLSLEYHPFLAKQCDKDAVPAVRYLQCPASVKIQHLKRFLCSKFDIDPNNKLVEIEIIYEDEVLSSDFTLMDVCYCYNWKRHAPLKFFYRILIYSEEQSRKLDKQNSLASERVSGKSSGTFLGNVVTSAEPKQLNDKTLISQNGNDTHQLPPPLTTKVKSNKSSSSTSSKHHHKHVTIAPKPVESKKSGSRKSLHSEDFVLPNSNDFKSLRSNDMRYSQYSVTSTTPMATPECKPKVKEEKPQKCDIVVSIPHNQMHEEWESKPLAQLKTASKKSPSSQHAGAIPNEVTSAPIPVPSVPTPAPKKVKNVPKLKIELNSLRTKLIEKPKSADIRLDSLIIKHHRPRKMSLDEKPTTDRVDLETYVKNIGLKPIEAQTGGNVSAGDNELPEKFTPNVSPRSSCSSSTTSSSNGHLNLLGDISTSTSSSSSHKKRKKKHSKEPRDSKRKKMHAEISSRGADESLKMKVKLTAPLNIKPSKLESKKSPSTDKPKDPLALEVTVLNNFEKFPMEIMKSKEIIKEKTPPAKEEVNTLIEKKFKEALKLKPLAIKTCAKDFEDDDDDIVIPDTTSGAGSLTLSKPLTNLKDDKLPHSPPLPPSLFKTTPIPLPFSSFTPNNLTPIRPKPMLQTKEKTKPFTMPMKMKPLAPKPMPAKTITSSMKPPQFAVPKLPRLMPSGSAKFISSTPPSIASSANKQLGNLLKRSVSLDESKAKGSNLMAKQPKLERPHQITVSAYGSNLQVTKVEVPATPTSSTAKATYEIPLYSPLSASYNPKCSFTVSSASANSKGVKPTTSFPLNAGNKSQIFSNSVAAAGKLSPEVEEKKSSNHHSLQVISNTTLMGPPLPLNKMGTVVPTKVKSPPLGNVLPLNCTKSYTFNSATNSLNKRPILAQTKMSKSEGINNSAANGSLGLMEKPKCSLRQFRLPSRESGQEILDLSAGVQKTITTTSAKTTSTTSNGLNTNEKKSQSIPPSSALTSIATASGTPLELALTKIKKNINSSDNGAGNSGAMELKPNSDDLQNLHMLSESATAREKIAINSSSLYEKAKQNQNTMVRQQNASVRSIPNPSALAFRNHQPSNTNNIPMVTIAAPLFSSLSNEVDKGLLSSKHTPTSTSPQSPNCAMNSTSPTRSSLGSLMGTKKHPSIDQVAASLNIRASAAAAAEASAKANLKQLDDGGVNTTTTTTTAAVMASSTTVTAAEAGGGNKLKQIKQETPEQITTTTPAPTSTTTTPNSKNQEFTKASSSSSTEQSSISSGAIVEIKQEPEEKYQEEQQRGDIRAPTLAMNTTITMPKPMPMPSSSTAAMKTMPSSSSSSSSSKVENLVTSVINVSTPTSSTLLTTTSAGGF